MLSRSPVKSSQGQLGENDSGADLADAVDHDVGAIDDTTHRILISWVEWDWYDHAVVTHWAQKPPLHIVAAEGHDDLSALGAYFRRQWSFSRAQNPRTE